MQTLLDNHWNGSGQAQMTDELENDIDYPDSIPPRKSRLAALLMAAFVITLILALLASMLIGQPQGDPIRPPTITPTINPTYKNGSLLLPRRNKQRLFLPVMLEMQRPLSVNVTNTCTNPLPSDESSDIHNQHPSLRAANSLVPPPWGGECRALRLC